MHNFVIPVKLVLDPDRGTGVQSRRVGIKWLCASGFPLAREWQTFYESVIFGYLIPESVALILLN